MSPQYCWRHWSSAAWRCVTARVILDVAKHHSAFIFKVKQSKKNGLLDPDNEVILILQIKCWDQHRIPEDSRLQQTEVAAIAVPPAIT
jgi:hypothetical protein